MIQRLLSWLFSFGYFTDYSIDEEDVRSSWNWLQAMNIIAQLEDFYELNAAHNRQLSAEEAIDNLNRVCHSLNEGEYFDYFSALIDYEKTGTFFNSDLVQRVLKGE